MRFNCENIINIDYSDNNMCMISTEIRAVAATKLFCGLNNKKTRQITVYSNTVDNVSKNNAMVLPVPFPKSVVFHNLENYKTFFSDCESCFYKPMARSLSMNYDGDSYTGQSAKLAVFNVGSYKVSLAMSIGDLKKVDTTVFELSDGLDKVLKKYYSKPIFGFIICKLTVGNEKYHPFAYSHDIIKGKVFIPTRHYHDETKTSHYYKTSYFGPRDYHSFDNINNSLMFGEFEGRLPQITNTYPNMADDWDHDIYLYNVDLNSNSEVKKMNQCKSKWSGKVKINFDKLDFPLDEKCDVFTKIEINGAHRNMDIVLATY